MTIRTLLEETLCGEQEIVIDVDEMRARGTVASLSLMINDALDCQVCGIIAKEDVLWIYGTGVAENAC